MLLYRPIGLEELRLLYEADLRAFPPRLPDQPIFYPVTNEGYAAQIARDWNTKSGTKAGFVTRFAVADAYVARFDRKVVGAREHEELWVPAEELPDFNANLEGRVEVIAAWFGPGFEGVIPEVCGLKGRTARAQLVALAQMRRYSGFDFASEIGANHTAVFLHFAFWEQTDFNADGVDDAERDAVLEAIRRRWTQGPDDAPPLGVERRIPLRT